MLVKKAQQLAFGSGVCFVLPWRSHSFGAGFVSEWWLSWKGEGPREFILVLFIAVTMGIFFHVNQRPRRVPVNNAAGEISRQWTVLLVHLIFFFFF